MTITPTHRPSMEDLECYSKQIYSDNKILRTSARQRLIEATEAFTKLPRMTEDDEASFPSWTKLRQQMRQMINDEEAPFAIHEDKAGVIHQQLPIHGQPPSSHTDFRNSNKPSYIVTMAHTPPASVENRQQQLLQQIALIENEAFGADAAASKKEAKQRLAIVVGINYCHGLDNARNRSCRQYIDEVSQQIDSPRVKILAFNWTPVWIENQREVSSKQVKRLYRLLSDSSPQKAQVIYRRAMSEISKVIPYQRVREEIKNSNFVSSFYTNMKHGFVNRRCYLTVWDDDAVSLRTEDNKGLFSHYDELIAQNPGLKVASTGYFMRDPTQGFIEFASRIDLVARRAIAHTLPNGAYLPEPNLIVHIADLESLKSRITFIRKGATKGMGLEFLGLMENLNLMKGNVQGVVVMGKRGAILTSKPARAKVPSHMPRVISQLTMNNPRNLASLRMFCQSVLNPQKGFAASVARALPTGAGSRPNTGLISKLYTAFDPIEYSKTLPNWKRSYSYITDLLIRIYNAKIDNENTLPDYEEYALNIAIETDIDTDEKDRVKTLLETKSADIWKARKLIKDKVVNEERFLDLFYVVINVNKAVHAYLASHIDQTAFTFPELLER